MLYSKLKSSIGLEQYLSELTSFKNRQILTKYRTSDHCLQIETGRYKNIPRQQRLCNIRNHKVRLPRLRTLYLISESSFPP